MTLDYKKEAKFFATVALGAGVFAAGVFYLGNPNNLDRIVTGTINGVGGAIQRVEPAFSDPNGVRIDRLAPQPRREFRAEVTQQEIESFENHYHRGMCEYYTNNGTAADLRMYQEMANVDCARWGF